MSETFCSLEIIYLSKTLTCERFRCMNTDFDSPVSGFEWPSGSAVQLLTAEYKLGTIRAQDFVTIC